MLRGSQVMRGYHNMPEETARTLTHDGWLHTGDLGSMDTQGYVTITGRAKDIIVTAGGKNVSPAPLEDIMRSHPLISQAVVIGDGRPFISALITLDAQMLTTWLRNHGYSPLDVADAPRNRHVRAGIQRAIDRANATVSKAESIRSFRIVDGDFTERNGLLTPSMKVKRNAVCERYAADIDAIYAKKRK